MTTADVISFFSDLKAVEVAAIILGVVGFLMSCLNAYSSWQKSREERKLLIVEKQGDLLGVLYEAQLSQAAMKLRLQSLLDENKAFGGPDIYNHIAQKTLDRVDETLKRIDTLRPRLEGPIKRRDYHQVLVQSTRDMGWLKSIAAAKDIQLEIDELYRPLLDSWKERLVQKPAAESKA